MITGYGSQAKERNRIRLAPRAWKDDPLALREGRIRTLPRAAG